MTKWLRSFPNYVLPAGMAVLAVVLLSSSVRSVRELDEMKGVFLRNKAAALAGRLENLDAAEPGEDLYEMLAGEEPALADLRIYRRGGGGGGSSIADSIFEGRELFHTQLTNGVFRAHVPFHAGGRMFVARIDLDGNAADFLLVHSRHHLIIAAVSGAVLVLLSFYFAWLSRRAALLERRRLALEHLAQLGKMSAVLAHEIRNPLGTIKGFAQLAGEKADAGVRALLEPALEETRRLEKLVSDLLLYGRPRPPELREVEWRPLAGRIEAHALQSIGGRPVRFSVTQEDFPLLTDPDLLEQALLNLVRNSIEAIPADQHGLIELRARRSDAGVVIEVNDDGPGIPESVSARLFEPFQTTKPFGTGLGLAITRKITESLGGRLEVAANQPHGVRITLRFAHGNHSRS